MSRRSDRTPPAQPGAPARAAQAVARRAPQEVRIIGGRLKRTPLSVPTWPGLRPTPARVRETLFNWLGQDLTGWRVLDAFAGSGALGLEAASRGAQEVLLIEREGPLAQHLRATISRLQLTEARVLQDDALSWMQRCAREHTSGRFDLILLDPPFDDDLFDQALARAVACVPVGGWIYLEASQAYGDDALAARPLPADVRLHRQGRAGAVHYHLIQRMDAQATAPATPV